MNPQLATIIYVAGIAGLFYLDRDRVSRVSKGLWIPVLWLLIVASRPVSVWLQSGPTVAIEQQNTEGSPVDAAVFGVLILAGIAVLCMRSRKVKSFLRANWPILLFFSYCLLSIAWSDYSFVAFKRWIKAIGDLVMVLIVLTDPDPLVAAKRFFSRATFWLLPISVLFIKYYPDLGRAYNQWTWTPMYTGVTTFKNLLGMTCLVCGLSSLWSFMGAYRDKKMPYRVRHMLAHGAMILMAVWLIHTADSMTSLSCLLMAGTLIVFTSQSRHATRVKVAHCLVAGAIIFSLCGLFIDPSALLPSLGRNSTLTGRREIWTAVLAMHSNPLLGTGFESFWMGDRLERVWQMSVKGIQEAHDGYLEVYLNLGWAGLAFLAGIIVTGYRNVLTVFREDPHAGRLRLAFFTAGIIYSLTEAGFRMMSPIWVGFLLAVTCVPAEPQRRPKEKLVQSPINEKVEKSSLQTADVFRIGSKLAGI
jgi:exopolysaccharide production protein ExoQ